MDPNANLEEQRRISARIVALADKHPRPIRQMCAEASRLAELVQALDEWLSRGGFRPTAWIPLDEET